MLLIIFTLGKSFQRITRLMIHDIRLIITVCHKQLLQSCYLLRKLLSLRWQLLIGWLSLCLKLLQLLKALNLICHNKTLHSLLLLQWLSLRNLPQIFALDYWQFQSALFADNCSNHIKDFICSIAYCFNWLGINKLLQLFLCFCHKHFCSKNSLILLHYPAVDIPSLCLYSCPFQRTGFLSQMYLWYGIKPLLCKWPMLPKILP